MKQSTNSLKSAHNTDFFGEKLAKIRQILPEIFSENQLDIDKIKTLLGEHIAQNERYGLNWAGKSAAYQALQRPTNNTLTPCPAESMDFETTQNIFIESDNLEALKILQKSYAGKVKMIYIDPPYNTGNDFIYHDDFSQTKTEYEIATGDRDVNGKLLKSFKKNSKDNGRYHSNWLNMMLPRLHLARTLLADDGVIFISIDDNEQAQLKLLCDEIFGEENFINNISIKMSELSGVKMKHLNKYAKLKETLLIYSKNNNKVKLKIEKKRKSKEDLVSYLRYYSQIIENLEQDCSEWVIINLNDYFKKHNIILKDDELNDWKLNNAHRLIYRTNSKTIDKYILENPTAPKICKILNNDGKEIIKWDNKEMLFLEKYIEEYLGDIWLDISTINLNKEIETLPFENGQKPLSLLKRVIKTLDTKQSIIMDFFAGSSSTAHAVMQLNLEDEVSRKFIMVQLPEILDVNNASTAEGKKIIQNAIDFCNENNLPTNIAEISKERIRRAGAKIKADNPAKNLDVGFKVFKLSDSNFKTWQVDDDNIADQLEMYIDPLAENAKEIDIVYELLLKMGLKLTADIEFKDGVYWLTCENKLYAIVLNSLSQDEFNAIIAKKPAKTVVLDKAFLNDSQKSNVILQFKDAGLNFESI